MKYNIDINIDELVFQLNTSDQELEIDDGECGTPITTEGDVEHAEDIMDHCIEVESNERMRNENIDRWTLRFKQPEIETKVRPSMESFALFFYSTNLHYWRIQLSRIIRFCILYMFKFKITSYTALCRSVII